MKKTWKIAVIGLDTSHSVEMPKLMQDPSVPADKRVDGMKAVRCLRFDTPFQGTKGLDERQAYMESIGVKVTEDFDEAVKSVDALMLEINDPAYHLAYFEKCAALGKPIFLDKPFADTVENALRILSIAREKGTRFFTASPLRFDDDMVELAKGRQAPKSATVYAPVGKAFAGSSIVWYGVHAFEILELIMGQGAATVTTLADHDGYVCLVAYHDGRRGVVELTKNNWNYGAFISDPSETVFRPVSRKVSMYKRTLEAVRAFFNGKYDGVPHEESLEIMAMLEAAERSAATGRPEPVYLA